MRYHSTTNRVKEQKREKIGKIASIFEDSTMVFTQRDATILIGRIRRPFDNGIKSGNTKVYENQLEVTRQDGKKDYISILIPEKIVKENALEKEKVIKIIGEFRSRESDGNILLYVFVKDISVLPKTTNRNNNTTFLRGHIIEEPIYTEGMLNFMVEITKNAGRPYIIPCFLLAKEMKYALKQIKEGEEVILVGKINTRSARQKDKCLNEKTKKVHELYTDEILAWRDFIL